MTFPHRIAGPAAFLLALLLVACTGGTAPAPDHTDADEPAATDVASPSEEVPMTDDAADDTVSDASDAPAPGAEVATFGAGCFWCVEAVLEQLDGVADVRSGYMGGDVEDPTYEQVCSGSTGHAEVVQVAFDPARISYDELLDWFWQLHDPTTPNRQGMDVGTQYRSVIFTHSEAQAEAARRSRDAQEAAGVFDAPIVTEISEAGPFYEAERHHQDYYRSNRSAGYCRAVIRPKLEKLGLDE